MQRAFLKKVPALPLTCLLKISKKIKNFVTPGGDTSEPPPILAYKISRSYNLQSLLLGFICNLQLHRSKIAAADLWSSRCLWTRRGFCRCAVLRRNDVTGIFSNALRRVKTQKNHLESRPIRLCNVEIALSIVRLP